MKTIFGVMAMSFLGMTAFAAHAETYYTQAQTDKLVKVCQAAQSDKIGRLNKAKREANLSYKKMAEGVVCNGEDIVEFAITHRAYNTAQYIADKAQLGKVIIRDIAKN